jgi:hypothetical protein
LFTVTLGMPGIAWSSFCTVRAWRSDAPPGPEEDTISMFLEGLHSCALAVPAASAQERMRHEG